VVFILVGDAVLLVSNCVTQWIGNWTCWWESYSFISGCGRYSGDRVVWG